MVRSFEIFWKFLSRGFSKLHAALRKRLAWIAGRFARSRPEESWRGVLKVGEGEVVLILRVKRGKWGRLDAELDSPFQGILSIHASRVKLRGRRLLVEIESVKGRFDLQIGKHDRSMRGSWTQLGTSFDVVLEKVEKEPALSRPQEPRRPFPYREEEVEYGTADADVKLVGVLTLPGSSRPPAVVFVGGSGPQDRDESMFGHKPFLILADYLTRRGLATLRSDDRGVGGSSGDSWTATARDLTNDVLSGVEYLKNRGDIDSKRIGLLGHSEGAVIAASASSRSDNVAFLVMLAGPVAIGADIIERQIELIAAALGEDASNHEDWREANRAIFEILRQESDRSAAEARVGEILDRFEAPPPDRLEENARTVAEARRKILFSPWFRSFLNFDAAAVLRKVTCPVLAINGERDLQVDPKQNLPLIEAALLEAGNHDFTIKELPGLNHLLQHCRSGSPTEYPWIEETIAGEALELIASWIEERVRGKPGDLEGWGSR